MLSVSRMPWGRPTGRVSVRQAFVQAEPRKGDDAERIEGIALCPSCIGRFTEGPPDAVLAAMENEDGPLPDAVAAAWEN